MFTASLDDPHVVSLGTFNFLLGGTQVTGLAADWRLHAFSWVSYDFVEELPNCWFDPFPAGGT